MSKRYSVLKPLTIEILEDVTLQMISFFQLLNALQFNGISGEGIVRHSVNDFIKHMTQLRGGTTINIYNKLML